MTEYTDKCIRTSERTNDQQLVLAYDERDARPHNPLHLDFRWETPDGELRSGPFVTYQEAEMWRQGYDYATRAQR